jgi:mono/diheme cytochrome c family protein
MKNSGRLLTAIPIVLLATAATAADADHGRDLAERWCAACHMTGPNQRQATEAAPFATIAKRRDFDEARLAFFLLDPHPKMPNMGLTRAEATDLAAYIKSLQN